MRLSEMRFIKFTNITDKGGPIVELDFDAIGKY